MKIAGGLSETIVIGRAGSDDGFEDEPLAQVIREFIEIIGTAWVSSDVVTSWYKISLR